MTFQSNFSAGEWKSEVIIMKKAKTDWASYQQITERSAPRSASTGSATQMKTVTKDISPCNEGISLPFIILIILSSSPSLNASFSDCFISKYIILIIRKPQKILISTQLPLKPFLYKAEIGISLYSDFYVKSNKNSNVKFHYKCSFLFINPKTPTTKET